MKPTIAVVSLSLQQFVVCNYAQENVEKFLASLKSDFFTKPNKDEKPYFTKDEDIGES